MEANFTTASVDPNRLLKSHMREIITAYCDGKPVEILLGNSWATVVTPAWDFEHYRYRIKPSVRPFADMMEFMKTAVEVRAQAIVMDTTHYTIRSIQRDGLVGSFGYVSWQQLADKWRFACGRPCGVIS